MIKQWITDHKIEILITSCILGTAIVSICVFKHYRIRHIKFIDKANPLIASSISSKSIVDAPKITRAPHVVKSHIRNLPNGYNASTKKLAEAFSRNIILEPNQTIVDSYWTGNIAA